MKMKETLKKWIAKPYSAVYILLFVMFVIGAVSDGFGHINELVQLAGFLLEIISMTAIIAFLIIWFHYDKNANIKMAAILAVFNIIISLILISIFWSFPMFPFLFAMFSFMVVNFWILCVSIIFIGMTYYDKCINNTTNEDEEKQINDNDDNMGIGTII